MNHVCPKMACIDDMFLIDFRGEVFNSNDTMSKPLPCYCFH